MKVLITGIEGMLGHDLHQELRKRHEVSGFDIEDIDIREKAEVTRFILKEKPEFVFHLAAFTHVDGAEVETGKAYGVNVTGTRNVAEECKARDVPLLFISTDYVFDGMKAGAYRETDEPNPINVYGKTKCDAERIVAENLDKWFIVRTSWLFGRKGKNFVDTIQKLANEKELLEVVDDQRGSPTYTRDIASSLARFLSTDAYGIYHVANRGSCSWFDFAREIVALTGSKAGIRPVKSEEMVRPAKRPANSVLDTTRFEEHFGCIMPPWQDALGRYLKEKGSG